jgi:GNAT superfamily N-acetyltransferase
MADPLVRPAGPGDEAGIAAAHVTSWQDAYRGHMPQDFLDSLDVGQRVAAWRRRLPEAKRSRGDLVVVESAGEIAGFALFGPSRDADADPERTGELGAIYLRPGSIGQGLGRLLMASAVSGLAGFGYAHATLWVLDANARARRFYERAGWAADGAVMDDDSRGFTIREVRYRRSLP